MEPDVDDFAVFAGSEHMFFGLDDPFGFVRAEIEDGLRSQVADTEVVRIRAHGVPRFLTVGRQVDEGRAIVVTHYAVCVRVDVAVTFDQGRAREVLPGTFTLLVGGLDEPERRVHQTLLDLHDDADRAYAADAFEARFLAFRGEVGPS